MANKTSKNSGGKGNPASKRIVNKARIAKRERSWLKNQRAKAIRIAENKAAFEANEVYRRQGLPTPYEARQLGRKDR